MSIGTDIIKRALQKIGVYSVFQELEPESIEISRIVLNSMIQEWETKGIHIGAVPLQASGDELSELADCTDGVANNLSVRLASDFNKVPSRELKAQAIKDYKFIKAHYQAMEIPNKEVSSTTPMGAGNSRYRTNDTFAGENKILNG